MRPTGKINFIFILILLAVGYGGWWLWTYGPVYLDNMDVKEATVSAWNVGKTPTGDDGAIRKTIMGPANAKTVGWHREEDEGGNLVIKEGIGLKPEQIVIERDEVNNVFTITVEYDREILLKPLDKVDFRHFVVTQTGPLK